MGRTLFAAVRLAVVLMLAPLLLGAKPQPPSYSPNIDLTAEYWEEIHGSVPLYNDGDGNLYFDFPSMPDASCKGTGTCDSVNYVTTTHVPRSITGHIVVTLTVDTVDDPTFHFTSEGGAIPPSVRAFFWAKYANYSNWNRWWSREIYHDLNVGSGTVTWTIPLEPWYWSTVYGERGSENPRRFYRSLDDVGAIGVTFGGGNNFGHGVFVVGGAARFTLRQYVAAPLCPDVQNCSAPACVRGSEVDATSTDLDYCVTSSGTQFLDCDEGQTVNVVTTHCNKGACCFAEPACLCPLGPCADREYLECR